MRSITQVLRQQARSISATAQRLQLLGDDWGVPPSDESNAACASESRAVRQKRYEEVSQASPNGRLGPGDETTVGKHGFMAGEQGGIHRDHGSCAHRRKNGSGRGRTRRAGWSWEVLEDGKLSGDAEDGVDDVCSRRGCVSEALRVYSAVRKPLAGSVVVIASRLRHRSPILVDKPSCCMSSSAHA